MGGTKRTEKHKQLEKEISQRFMDVFYALKKEGIIKTQSEYGKNAGFSSQILTALKNEEQPKSFSVTVLAMAKIAYPKISLDYITTGAGLPLLEEHEIVLPSDFRGKTLPEAVNFLIQENESLKKAFARLCKNLESKGLIE